MAYKFEADESTREAIARCAREQLEDAITQLADGINEDPERAVHEARKAIKKERSLLRLVRGAVPATERRKQNEALRGAARALAGTRDAQVLVATLDGLADHFAGQLPATTFAAIRPQLTAPFNGSANGVDPRAHAIKQLEGVRSRITRLDLRADGWSAVEEGLARSYGRGRKAFDRARAVRSPEAMHEWRKRVKDLWYHHRLLAPTCGPTVRGHAKDAHELADLLGDGHNLDLLRQELTREPVPVPVDVDAVVRLLDLRRIELGEQAIVLGARVYSEPSKAFRRRMKRLWKAGHALASAPAERHPAEVAAATRRP
jgi:CHAD domain-containing protein